MLGNEEALTKDIVRVFIFENWARYYYTVERGGTTYLEVPEEVLEQCRKTHPDLVPLLEDTNKTEITYESCRKNVGEFVCRVLDGQKYPPGKVDAALDSKAFKIELHMFFMWQRGHDSYLDQHRLSFDDWMEMFVNWRLMDEVKAFQTKLEQSPPAGEANGKQAH
jgi:hypothetical protein